MSYEFASGFKIRDQGAMHFLTFTVEGWIDIFSRQCYRDIVLDSFRFCQKNKGLQVGAYVIMSNHIHVIWAPTNDNLSDIVRDFKTFTSKAITKRMLQPGESRKSWLDYMFSFYANRTNRNEMFKLWTNNNHPEVIYTMDFLMTKLNYIHNNPVRAGLVRAPEDYIYSSASNYAGMGGVFEVDPLF